MYGRISKIRMKDGRIEITIVQTNGANEAETNHKIYDAPHPDFPMAMAALESHAREILQWPSDYRAGEVRIVSVSYSFSETTNVEGATISGLVNLETSNSPFSFNTPHLPFEQYSEGGVSPLMPDDAIEALETLRQEARDFLSGKKRAQGDMFGASAREKEPA